MKINVIKLHPMYEIGEHEVEDQRGNYLVAMKVAEAAGENEPEETEDKQLVSKEDEHIDKSEVKKRGRKPKKQK